MIFDGGPTCGSSLCLSIHEPVEEFTHSLQNFLTQTGAEVKQSLSENANLHFGPPANSSLKPVYRQKTRFLFSCLRQKMYLTDCFR